MFKQKSSWLAAGLAIVTIVLLLLNLNSVAAEYNVSADDPLSIVNGVLQFAYIAAFAIVGALIIAYQPRNTIGWLLMFLGGGIAVLGLVPDISETAAMQQQGTAAPEVLALLGWFSSWSWWFLMAPLFLVLQFFPTGRPLSPRWRWVVVLLVITVLYFVVFSGLSKQIQLTESGDQLIANPIGVLDESEVETALIPFFVMLVATSVLSVAEVVLRFLRGNHVERQQLKWFLSACALFLVIYVGQIFTNTSDGSYGSALFNLSMFVIPLSIGVAILRYRLWDIDVIIRRTLTYALVTALLAVVFFGSVVLLQVVFFNTIGTNQNELVTVISTLAIAALFVPVRNRIQNEIDKRFNRKKYDTQQVLNDFANTVRDETNLENLTARLMQVVDDTMQPRTVSVWLKEDKPSR